MDFGSLNLENIENILGSMSSEDMSTLSAMAQQLFSATAEKKSEPEAVGGIDGETVGKILSLMGKLSISQEDPRCRLLLSLRPLLTREKQDKVDKAVRLLSLLSLLPVIEELGGEGNAQKKP